MTKIELTNFLNTSNKLKPKDFIIDDLKWRYLLWAVVKGKNILLLGPTRCGKCLDYTQDIDVMVGDELYKKIMKNRKLL